MADCRVETIELCTVKPLYSEQSRHPTKGSLTLVPLNNSILVFLLKQGVGCQTLEHQSKRHMQSCINNHLMFVIYRERCQLLALFHSVYKLLMNYILWNYIG